MLQLKIESTLGIRPPVGFPVGQAETVQSGRTRGQVETFRKSPERVQEQSFRDLAKLGALWFGSPGVACSGRKLSSFVIIPTSAGDVEAADAQLGDRLRGQHHRVLAHRRGGQAREAKKNATPGFSFGEGSFWFHFGWFKHHFCPFCLLVGW